jgi:hypothetical protein
MLICWILDQRLGGVADNTTAPGNIVVLIAAPLCLLPIKLCVSPTPLLSSRIAGAALEER